MTGAEVLAQHGITLEPTPGASAVRFPDGAHYRIEIPSVEGPAVFLAAVEAAVATGVGRGRGRRDGGGRDGGVATGAGWPVRPAG